jgi:hypothetical protein
MERIPSNLLYVAAYKKPENCNFDNPVRKVGITGNEKARMGTLSNSTEAYSEIEAVQLWKLPQEIPAKEAEDYIHDSLDIFGLRTNREWFNGDSIENNKIEEFVELYMLNLKSKGFKIVALHEKIDADDEKHEIVSDDHEKIKIIGSRHNIPESVTINGEKIQYSSFADILKSVFRYLVDKDKINKEICPISRKENNKNYLVNVKPEHSDDSPFRSTYEYKNLFIELHGNHKVMISNSNYLIDTFGNREFILNIVEAPSETTPTGTITLL